LHDPANGSNGVPIDEPVGGALAAANARVRSSSDAETRLGRVPSRQKRRSPLTVEALALVRHAESLDASHVSPDSAGEMRPKQGHHVGGIWIAPQHRLRKDQVAACVNVEDAVCSRHELDSGDARLELFEDLRCQTDSVWPRTSGNAVLDANEQRINHHHDRSSAAVDVPHAYRSTSTRSRPCGLRTSQQTGGTPDVRRVC
jgi:hypothetical protein